MPGHLRLASAIARWATALAATALLVGQAPAASAQNLQNLLINPDFDTGLSGWQVFGTTSWDGTYDANGSLTSGSAKEVLNESITNGIYPAVAQCVPLVLGATYDLGGKITISSLTEGATAFFLLVPYPTADCSGPPPPGPFIQTPPVPSFGGFPWTDSATTFANSFAHSGLFSANLSPMFGGQVQANFDNVFVEPGNLVCAPDTLCLLGSRFRVTAAFDTGTGSPSNARPLVFGAGGIFWFFDPANIEVMVKVIDGCALGGHFWFFAAGLTDVNVVIEVTDTLTGAKQVYTNPPHTAFRPIQDTATFPCP
jgi:hypothetical protein